MPYPYHPPAGNTFAYVGMADVGTADSRYVVPGFQGRVKAFWSVINGAITGSQSSWSQGWRVIVIRRR
jgi:hypothetical protein